MKLQFTGKQKESGNVWSFYFDCPEAEWIAGQSIRLELPRPTWGVDERRFTIASSPSEKRIQITTQISDSTFKQSLAKLKPGQEIDGYNIEGKFTWVDKGEKLMIAGGMGITPYRSLIKSQLDEGKPCNTTIIYSSKDEHLFQKEFTEWSGLDQSLRIILLSKRLSIDKNSTLLDKWLKSTIYVSGPEAMVRSLQSQFLDQKIPMSHIKTDIFTGLQ